MRSCPHAPACAPSGKEHVGNKLVYSLRRGPHAPFITRRRPNLACHVDSPKRKRSKNAVYYVAGGNYICTVGIYATRRNQAAYCIVLSVVNCTSARECFHISASSASSLRLTQPLPPAPPPRLLTCLHLRLAQACRDV